MNRKQFLTPMDNTCNHRVLLWEALKLTDGMVVEFGSGHGSTPFLSEYCEKNDRKFVSYENNMEWSLQTGSSLIEDWDLLPKQEVSVLFIDHAPGERRKFDIVKNDHSAKIIVVHDSEPTGGGDYKVRKHFKAFKYVAELKTEGAWATILSNHIDVTKCIGEKFGEYVISEYGE